MSFRATSRRILASRQRHSKRKDVVAAVKALGAENASSTRIDGPRGSTDFVKVVIPGSNGKSRGGDAPTLGVIGRLGGIGARPEMIGFVSDGDGAAASVAVAMKLARMAANGDVLPGDVICATHICPVPPRSPRAGAVHGSPVEHGSHKQVRDRPADGRHTLHDTTKGNPSSTPRLRHVATVKDGGFSCK